MKVFNIQELFNSSKEYKDIIRAISGFLLRKQKIVKKMKRIILTDASTYKNEFAIAVAALSLNYSNVRANNLLGHYINSEFSALSNKDIEYIFQKILFPNGMETGLYKSINKVQDDYLADVEVLNLATDILLDTGGDLFNHVETILNTKTKNKETHNECISHKE